MNKVKEIVDIWGLKLILDDDKINAITKKYRLKLIGSEYKILSHCPLNLQITVLVDLTREQLNSINSYQDTLDELIVMATGCKSTIENCFYLDDTILLIRVKNIQNLEKVFSILNFVEYPHPLFI